MIISFSIKNWMSFRDETCFSMIASREKQHGERLPRLTKYKMRVLPISTIYGGNAAGKTNFFKALNFVKRFVLRGTGMPDSFIQVEPYRLKESNYNDPSCFTLELLINDNIYEFSFSATKKAVIHEKLVYITKSKEKVLYHRHGNNLKELDETLSSQDFLQHVFKGTRDNQLYLTNSIYQKVDSFMPVYNWFKNNLELIAPDSRFEPFEHFINEDSHLYNTMNEMLSQLDTGISHLGGEKIEFNNLPLFEPVKERINEDIKDGQSVKMQQPMSGERFIITRKNGNLIAKKMVTYHKNEDGKKVKFEIHDESDGSQRVINLLPAFLEISSDNSRKVYIIDEVDRSLHTLLTRRLIEFYLEACGPESRAQLLMTTHDVALMDQSLFRRDEMWVSERGSDGNSYLIAFNDYKDIRYDKNIRKSYLLGRLGGTPNLN